MTVFPCALFAVCQCAGAGFSQNMYMKPLSAAYRFLPMLFPICIPHIQWQQKTSRHENTHTGTLFKMSNSQTAPLAFLTVNLCGCETTDAKGR